MVLLISAVCHQMDRLAGTHVCAPLSQLLSLSEVSPMYVTAFAVFLNTFVPASMLCLKRKHSVSYDAGTDLLYCVS